MPSIAAQLGSSTTEDTAQQITGDALFPDTPYPGYPDIGQGSGRWNVDHDGQPFADQFVQAPSASNPHPATLKEGYDFSNVKMHIELPPLAELAGPTCRDDCALKQKQLTDACNVQRQRVQLWLKNNGCPSTVKAVGKPKKGCGNASKARKRSTAVTKKTGGGGPGPRPSRR